MRKLLLTLVGLLTCMSLMAADVNFNFANNSYGITATTSSQGSGTATNQGVTVKAAKCGYKESESLRVYTADDDDSPELTISAPSGSKITKITFTLSQGAFSLESGQRGSYSNNMWQYGTGLESVKFTCSSQTRVTQIGVSLSDNGGSTTTYVAKPTISPNGGEIYENTYIYLSSTTPGVQMHYSWDGGVTYQDGFNPEPQAGTLQAYATKDGVSSEMAYAVFTMASAGGDDPVTPITGKGWQLVTSVSQLAVGDKVIIANQEAAKAMSTEEKDNNRPSAEITFNDDKSVILNPSVSVLQLKIGGSMDAWTFETLNYLGADGNGYLSSVDNSGKSSKNHCVVNATVSAGSQAKITIDATTKAATVQFSSTGTNVSNYMRYNSGLFACYKTATSQNPVFIYKWIEDEIPPTEKPAIPVVTAANGETIEDEAILPYGTKITVYSAGADMMSCTINDSEELVESDTHTFTLTEDVICEYYGSNDNGDGNPVYFMINVAKADLTVMYGSTEVIGGESYSVAEGTELTLTTTTGITLNVYDENLEVVATIEGKSLKYTISGDCTLTFEATTPANNTSATIDEVVFVIDQNAYADAFTLVTSTDEITDRDEYVLMYTDKNGNNYAMANTYTATNNRYLSADTKVTVSGDQLNVTDNTMIFTFVTIDGKRYLMVDNYGNDGFKYMSGRTGGNNYTDLKDAISDLGVVTATITDDGYADICFINALNGESPRYLRFNNSASPKCFSLYKASDAVKLYKREFAMPTPMEAHTDSHFVISSNGGTLYVKEFEGLKPGVEITPKAVHTALEGFVPQTGDWTKEKTLVEDYQTVEAYVEHKGRVSDILSINLHPDGTTTTGIENVGADVEGAAEYFNLQGMRISEPAKGQVVIRRQGARVEKIAVR